MTDFKVGDRVRVTCSTHAGRNSCSGDGSLREKTRSGWLVALDNAQEFTYSESDLTLLDRPYEPRDGDEITISMRGKVAPAMYGDWNFTTADFNNHTFSDFEGYEVTVHKRGPEPKPKLPATPGSVVRYKGDNPAHLALDDFRFLASDGVWYSRDQPILLAVDAHDRYEVIFDAGLRAEGSESFPTSGRDGAK